MTVDAYYAAVDAAEERSTRGMTHEQFQAQQTARELRELAEVDQMDRRTRVVKRHG